jgi:putative ABC transport system permease protein
MARDELEGLTGLRGAFNEMAVRLAPGADERWVIGAIDRILEPYGGRGAFGRDSQPSHTMFEEHIRLIRSLTVVMPAIFLLVAAFLVNVVLARLVASQREQIGLLKAFGYTSGRVALHYVELTLLVVLPGVALGLPVGASLGSAFADFFGRFFRFPVLLFHVAPSIALQGAVVAVASAMLGGLGAVRRVAAMPPIVAMAPEIPRFRRSLLDRFGLPRLLRPAGRMILRNVTRRPLRSVLAVAGMSLAVAVVMLGTAVKDASDRMRDVRYQAAEREDMSVTLIHPRAVGSLHEMLDLPGVLRAEPYRVVPTRVAVGTRLHDVILLGLPAGGVLRNAVDNAYHVDPVPPDGAIVTAWLAHELGLRRGDLLPLEIRENRRRVVTVRAVDWLDEPLGAAVYMDLGALGRLLGEPDTYSGANLIVDPTRARDLYAVLKRAPAAVAVDFRRGDLASFRAMGDAAVEFIRKIEVVFAIVIAFGVVYNSAKIAFAERARDLATLRVLGFTRGEVARILLGEIGSLAAVAVPVGFGLGYGLSILVIGAMNGERMHPPHILNVATYGFAFAVFAVAAAASALVVVSGLKRLDLVGVLKARE